MFYGCIFRLVVHHPRPAMYHILAVPLIWAEGPFNYAISDGDSFIPPPPSLLTLPSSFFLQAVFLFTKETAFYNFLINKEMCFLRLLSLLYGDNLKCSFSALIKKFLENKKKMFLILRIRNLKQNFEFYLKQNIYILFYSKLSFMIQFRYSVVFSLFVMLVL